MRDRGGRPPPPSPRRCRGRSAPPRRDRARRPPRPVPSASPCRRTGSSGCGGRSAQPDPRARRRRTPHHAGGGPPNGISIASGPNPLASRAASRRAAAAPRRRAAAPATATGRRPRRRTPPAPAVVVVAARQHPHRHRARVDAHPDRCGALSHGITRVGGRRSRHPAAEPDPRLLGDHRDLDLAVERAGPGRRGDRGQRRTLVRRHAAEVGDRPAGAHRPRQVRRQLRGAPHQLGERVVVGGGRAPERVDTPVPGAGELGTIPLERGGAAGTRGSERHALRLASIRSSSAGRPASRARSRAPRRSRCRAGRAGPRSTGSSSQRAVSARSAWPCPNDQHRPPCAADPRDDPVQPLGDLRRRSRRRASGASRPSSRARSRRISGGGDPLVVAVVPLGQVVVDLRVGEPGQLGGTTGALAGAGQHQVEVDAGEPVAQRRRDPDPLLGQRQVGRRGVPAVAAPLGLAVPDQPHLVDGVVGQVRARHGTIRPCGRATIASPMATRAPEVAPALRQARLAAAAGFFTQGLVFISLTTRLPDVQDHWALSAVELSLLLLMMVLLAGLGSRGRRDGVPSAATARRCCAPGCSLIAVAVPGARARARRSRSSSPRWRCTASRSASSTPPTNMQAVALEHRYGRPILPSFHGAWTLGGVIGAGARAGHRRTCRSSATAARGRACRSSWRFAPVPAPRAEQSVVAAADGRTCPGGRSCWSGWRWCSSTWSTPPRSPGDRTYLDQVVRRPVRPGRAGDVPLPAGQRRRPARRRRASSRGTARCGCCGSAPWSPPRRSRSSCSRRPGRWPCSASRCSAAASPWSRR